MIVDIVGRGDTGVVRSRRPGGNQDPCCDRLTHGADHDRGLAGLQRGDEPARVNANCVGILWRVLNPVRNVPGTAIGVACHRLQVDGLRRRGQEFLLRRYAQRYDSDCIPGIVIRCALFQPREDGPVLQGIGSKAKAAAVRDLRCGLEQNETLVRLLAINPMSVASGKGFVIEARFVAEERQLEASLTANGSVAVRACAPAHGEDRADIPNETYARLLLLRSLFLRPCSERNCEQKREASHDFGSLT